MRDHAPWRGADTTYNEERGEEFDFVVQIWGADGTRLYQSRLHIGVPRVSTLGFVTVRGRAEKWRVYSTQEGAQRIQIAQPLWTRDKHAFQAALRTLCPVLLLLPVVPLFVWYLVGRTLSPLDRLAREVSSRTANALDALSEEGAVQETLPLVRSLNDLMRRLSLALSAQRAFVADAAHELRTPLAVLHLQLQLAERAADPGERAAALPKLGASLDRVRHMVEQLLTLAREEPEAAETRRVDPMALAEIVGQVVADHVLVAEAKGIDLGALQLAEQPMVVGDAAALRILLSNLVENAIRYTPHGGRIDVATGFVDGRPYLEVADNGPGIPAAERGRVFDRFYRRVGSAGSGSGLGLAIVRAIANRHEGSIELSDTPGGGLTVRVIFPVASGLQSVVFDGKARAAGAIPAS